MMFYAEQLRVVLATVHVAAARRAAAADARAARLHHRPDGARAAALRLSATPRIALAGLNPHAGEHGVIGERGRRGPAAGGRGGARERGIDITGPWPGDTVFGRAARGEFDVVIACYHDQGLIPVKLLAFGRAVNVTLGLPIIRTSVDHGTAFDIAGKGHRGRVEPGRSGEARC